MLNAKDREWRGWDDRTAGPPRCEGRVLRPIDDSPHEHRRRRESCGHLLREGEGNLCASCQWSINAELAAAVRRGELR